MSDTDWPGAPGLKQIPFRRVFAPLKRPVPDAAEIVTAYTDGQVTFRSNRSKTGYHEAANLSGFQGIEVGDFVVHGLDIMRGSLGVSDSHGAISSVCIVCRPVLDVNLRYVSYVLRQMALSGYPKALARGVREGGADFRRWDTLGTLPVPLLDRASQDATVAYLDRETAEIDAFIADQEELIGLLEERRVALTASIVVTAGQGSEVQALRRFILTIEQGVSPQAEGSPAEEGKVGVLKAGCVNNGSFNERENKQLPEGFEYSASIEVRSGDLVVNRASGSPKLLGSAAIVRHIRSRLILSDKTFRLKPTSGISTEYLELFMNSPQYRQQIESTISGAEGLAKNLPMSRLRALRIVVPTHERQVAAVAERRASSGSLDAAIADAREAIALSKERRAALISAAVTGQIDVTDRKRVLL